MDGLARLTQLAAAQFAAEAEVQRIEYELDVAKRTLRSLSEVQIPDIMEELEMKEFKTESGLQIKIKETAWANLSQERLVAGLEWLREAGHGGLIKTAVSVPFSKGGDDDAQMLVDRLNGEGFAATHESKVHSGTLSAAVRTMLAEGESIPMELLGVSVIRVAKLKVPK